MYYKPPEPGVNIDPNGALVMTNNLYFQALSLIFSQDPGAITFSISGYDSSVFGNNLIVSNAGSTADLRFDNLPEQWIELLTVSNNVTLDNNEVQNFDIFSGTSSNPTGNDSIGAYLTNSDSLEISNY